MMCDGAMSDDGVLGSHPARWSVAMQRALYGADGFYVAGAGAAGHFRTSVSASASVRAVFAGALGELLDRVDSALGRPRAVDFVDVGAGSAELCGAVVAAVGSDLAARVRPTVVELRRPPTDLTDYIRWVAEVPDVNGLLFANEWLDNVPIDVVVGGRVQLVDRDGQESAGPPPAADELAWLARWWPVGRRREIGLTRDRAWVAAVSRMRRGVSVAVDYSHVAAQRPTYGTLTGFRLGRDVEPIPDGSCDLTAHVAIDSMQLAGERAIGAGGRTPRSVLTDQRSALMSLGVHGLRPAVPDLSPGVASSGAGGYAAALQRASDSAELIDPAGLGGFIWLLQGVELDPAALLP